ncbi:hypothetical protein J5J86_23465 [Aquabacter sp. L1I39]|uniref:hypothetical protein n=1 Tax=Aquabacter sp. L1I39 TaxID=2820278 RepID=UPI001ADD5DCD|nr:hypothetical protein [Aquabacter sp. L1I39]QTL03645.1 hypothetical protein J5J86_23465 [Aquabacter sp. L1I39]
MKALLASAVLVSLACGAAHAADAAGRSTIDVVVPVGTPAEPPKAIVVERITMYSLLTGGWQPVDAAVIPASGVPGTRGSFAHTDGYAIKLYKDGVYAYCGIAQVGGAYNDCRIAGSGTR